VINEDEHRDLVSAPLARDFSGLGITIIALEVTAELLLSSF
jgi:hypothetical protein